MIILKKILRKLYHLICFLSLILVFIPRVSAKTTINWAGEVSHTIDGWFSNCTSSSFCSSSGITQNSFLGFNDTSQSVVFPGLMSRLTSYNDNIGVQLGFSVNSVLKTDTLYSVRVYLCSGSLMHPLTWTTGNNESDISNHTYYADTRTSYFNNSANPQPFEYYSITGSNSVGSPSFSSCRIHSVIFRPTINSTFVGLQFNTDFSYTGDFWFIGYDLDVIGSANSISSSDLNNAINNSGLATANSVSQVQSSINQIQQDINSSANNIIDNNNQNTQDVIDNQNSNTDKQIDSQKVCKYIDKSAIKTSGYLQTNGNIQENSSYGVTDYITITGGKLKMTNSYNNGRLLFYDASKTKISSLEYANLSTNTEITIPSGAKYVRFCINKDLNRPTFELCFNGNQSLDNSVNSLTDSITDSNIDSSDDTINNLKNKIPTNSVISDLLLLPVRFLQNFVNALGSSCSQFNLGSLYGTNLYMPCINIENYLGSGIWTTIDLIISGLFVYALRKKFIQIYENLTNLKNGGNEVD